MSEVNPTLEHGEIQSAEIPNELLNPKTIKHTLGIYLLEKGDPEMDYWVFPENHDQPISKPLSVEFEVDPRTITKALGFLEEHGLAEANQRESAYGNTKMRVNERLSSLGRTVIGDLQNFDFDDVRPKKPKGHNFSEYTPEMLRSTLESIYTEISILSDEKVDTSKVDELMSGFTANPFHVKNDNISGLLKNEIQKAHEKLDGLIHEHEAGEKKFKLNPNQITFITLRHEIEGYMYVSGEEIPQAFLDIDPTKLTPESLIQAIGRCNEILSKMRQKNVVNPFELVG